MMKEEVDEEIMDYNDHGEFELGQQQQQHDQLPNVEEYKASMGIIPSSSSFGKNKIKTLFRTKTTTTTYMDTGNTKRPDPDGIRDYTTEEDYEYEYELPENKPLTANDNNNNIIIPTIHPHPYPSTSSSLPSLKSLRFWKLCGTISFAILLLMGILYVIGITKDPQELQSLYYDWMKGNTHDYNNVKEYVIRRGISHPKDFENVQSPQYMAAQWMAHGDVRSMSVPSGSSTTTIHLEYEERYVMVVLYFSLGGPNWTHQLNFLSEYHICAWYQEFEQVVKDDELDKKFLIMGVHDCSTTTTNGDEEEEYPKVLNLAYNNLNGTIPNEVRGLLRLESLVLESNSGLIGKLPTGMQQMTSLEKLFLQLCNLGGEIPSWLGTMSNLKVLGLGYNDFTGTVPVELGNLPQLTLLGLDNNHLHGSLDTFANLHEIKSFYMENNHFTGQINDSFYQNWPNLQELDFSDNDITGTLPISLFAMPYLEVLDFHNNQIQGPFPDIGGFNNRLQFVALQENQLTGDIHSSLSNLKGLKHLDVSVNQIQKLPSSLGTMTTLEYLFTGDNPFETGPMPSFIDQLTNLRELSMKENALTGPIPETIRYLSHLQYLDLHLNQLSGSLPEGIGKLVHLEHLLLKMNKLDGTLPAGLADLSRLEVFLIEQNSFTGNAGVICESYFEVTSFVADCGNGQGITCSCCSLCCDSKDPLCNTYEFDWRANLDPSWQYGYRRQRYSYSADIWLP